MRHSEVATEQPRRSGRGRIVVGLIGVVVAAGAVALTTRALTSTAAGWGDESVPATGPVPGAGPAAPSAPVTLTSYPLMVGDGLRVTAHESGITAHPVAAPGDDPAHWRYDRPDHEVVNVALATAPAGGDPVVVSLWDDGVLAAVDAVTGEVRWHAEVADDTALATGNFDPAAVTERGTLKVAGADGAGVAVVQVDDELIAVDTADGSELWQRDEGLCATAPAPLGSSHWWTTTGGHVVVDATCPGPEQLNATIRAIEPRTGDLAGEVDSQPAWQPVGAGDGSSVRPVGCSPDLSGCSLVEHHGTGNLGREAPVRWAVQDGDLVEMTRADADGLVAHPNGDFELFAVDRATGELAWKVTGQAYDLARPQFYDAATGDDAVWVASHSWEGGPPALVRLSSTDGSVTGCLPSPTTGAPTQVRTAGAHLVVSDFPWNRGTAFDPAAPDGTIHMFVPQPAPTCADAG